VSPSLQILVAGDASAPIDVTEMTSLGDGIRDQSLQWRAWVSYTPSGIGAGDGTGWLEGGITRPDLGTFTVQSTDRIDMRDLGEQVLDENNNVIGYSVFYGFTAANGAADDGHFITSAVPVPEPETWALMLAGLGLVAFAARRRAGLKARG